MFSAEMLGLRQLEDHDPQRVRRISIYDGHEFRDPAKWSVEQVYNFLKTLDGNTYAEGAEALKRSVSILCTLSACLSSCLLVSLLLILLSLTFFFSLSVVW